MPSGGSGPPALPLIFSVTVTGILANTLVGPAIPDILEDLGEPTSRAGLLVGASALPGIVVAPVIGVLADRFGRRAVLIPCLALFGIVGVASAAAPSLWWLLAARFVQGIGAAGLINLAVVVIGDHWDGIDRARLIGRNAAVLTISLAVVPPLGGFLTQAFGWRAAFLPYGFGLVTAVAVWRYLPGIETAPDGSVGQQLRTAITYARRPPLRASLVMGVVLFVLLFGLFLTALPVHLEEEFGLEAGARGLMIAVPAITSTAAALLLGRLRATFGLRGLMVLSWAVFAVAFAGIGLAGSVALLVPFALLYGVGEGALIPTLQDVAAGAAPASSRGAVVAVWVGAVRLGQATGPLLAAAVFGAFGTGTAFAVGAGVAAAVFVVATAAGTGRD